MRTINKRASEHQLKHRGLISTFLSDKWKKDWMQTEMEVLNPNLRSAKTARDGRIKKLRAAHFTP